MGSLFKQNSRSSELWVHWGEKPQIWFFFIFSKFRRSTRQSFYGLQLTFTQFMPKLTTGHLLCGNVHLDRMWKNGTENDRGRRDTRNQTLKTIVHKEIERQACVHRKRERQIMKERVTFPIKSEEKKRVRDTHVERH